MAAGRRLAYPVYWAGPVQDGQRARFEALPRAPTFKQVVSVAYGQCAGGAGPTCELYLTTFQLASPQTVHRSGAVQFADGNAGTIEYLGYIGVFDSTLAYLNTSTQRVQLMVAGRRSKTWITRFAETQVGATSQVP
jgi:hypothetical protein